MPKVLKRLFAWWIPVAEAISAFVGRIVLTLFYLVVALPFGLMARFVIDPLKLRRRRDSAWDTMRERENSIEEGRRQF